MQTLILFFLLAAGQTPGASLKVFPKVPPMARSCVKGTAAVRYTKDYVEKVDCYEHLKCEDGSAYGTGACECKPTEPVLNQDGDVSGCTAKAPPPARRTE